MLDFWTEESAFWLCHWIFNVARLHPANRPVWSICLWSILTSLYEKRASVVRSSERLCIFLKLAWHVNFRLERNRYFQDVNWTMKQNPDLAWSKRGLTPSMKELIFNVLTALWWPRLEFHEQKTSLRKNWNFKQFFLLPSFWLHFPNKCLHVLTFYDLYSRRRKDGVEKISRIDFALWLSDWKLLSLIYVCST